MLHSNELYSNHSVKSTFFSLLLVLSVASMLSSCVSFKNTENSTDNDPSTPHGPSDVKSTAGDKDKIKPETLSASNDTIDGQQKRLMPDPMANVVLPLELIKAYDKVNILNQSNNLAESASALQEIQKKYPQSSGPSYRLARIYQQQQKISEALESIAQAVLIEPKNYYALNLKGVLHRENGQFDLSRQAYVDAIKVYYNHPASHLNLAILADIYLYDLELALKHYEIYMALTNQTDEKAAGWIVDLKRRISKASEQENEQ